MTFVRLALEDDFDDIVEMAHAGVIESRDGVFNPDRVRHTLDRYIETANPTFWVCEHHRQVRGFLQAKMGLYDYRDGLYTSQCVLYVRPEFRGTRAAALLMQQLIDWSRHLGAIEIFGGNDNDFHSGRTAGFLEHFSFERCGFYMKRRLADGHAEK